MRQWTVMVCWLFFFLSIFPGCSKKEAGRVKIVYAMPTTVPAVLAYVADEKGFWKEEGLDVEAKMFPSGREALQALLARNAQVMSVSETPPVHAILQGNKIYCVATIAEHIETKLIARMDRGISRPKDLKGKKVATLPGTNSDYFMYEFLKKYGISPRELKIANMSPPDMVVAYVKGDIDAYFAWEPHIYYGKKQLPDVSIVFYPKELYRGRTTVNMNQDYVRQHPGVVRKLIRGLLKAESFVENFPEKALEMEAKRLNMERDVLNALWPEHVFKVQLDRDFLPLLEKVGRWAAELHKLKKPFPDFREYIYEEALKKERPSSVEIQ